LDIETVVHVGNVDSWIGGGVCAWKLNFWRARISCCSGDSELSAADITRKNVKIMQGPDR